VQLLHNREERGLENELHQLLVCAVTSAILSSGLFCWKDDTWLVVQLQIPRVSDCWFFGFFGQEHLAEVKVAQTLLQLHVLVVALLQLLRSLRRLFGPSEL